MVDLKTLQNKIRILGDWEIILTSDSDYKAQVCINSKDKSAEIYDWPTDTGIPMPDDFYFHELLHIANRALRDIPKRGTKWLDAEETLVQDICKIVREWNK
jgi:hypothetical protein